MQFANVLDGSAPVEEQKKSGPSKKSEKKNVERGCAYCPLNEVPGVNKIKGLKRLQGKKLMIWARNPGKEENQQLLELVGRSGKMLWEELAKYKIKRSDCDVQNVVRCFTVDIDPDTDGWTNLNREPSKEEVRCCSLYTDKALEFVQGETKVHLVLGEMAAKALLKGEYRKNQKTFFSERLKAWVVVTYHPAYFLRGAPRSKLREWQEAIRIAVEKTGQETGRFAYIESQDYQAVSLLKIREEIVVPIREKAAKGYRVSVDIEDGFDEKGENKLVYIGFSWKKGHSRGVFLWHKNAAPEASLIEALVHLKELLEDETVKKVFHHGSSDVEKLRELVDIHVKGYDFDTEYSSYFRLSYLRGFGLAAMADQRVREFAGYKEIIAPHKDPKLGRVNFYTLPRKLVIRYNGADCDITKRLEVMDKDKVNMRLLQVYIRAAFPIARMEENGPWFDKKHEELLQTWIPVRLKWLLNRLRKIAEEPNFNPGSPPQVSALLYDKLRLHRKVEGEWKWGRSTKEEVIETLFSYHPCPKLVDEYRKLSKKLSTYMEGYRLCAQDWGGRLRTKWWLTGTVSGRLRSGGDRDERETKGKKKPEEGEVAKKKIINLQNIHGDPVIECMLVSDRNWRKLYEDWKESRNA